MMASTREIAEEPPPPSPVHVVEDKMYIAVGRDVRESKSVVIWALRYLRNSGGRKICILHVHEPAQQIPMILGAKLAVSRLGEHEVRALREGERQRMNKLLQDYCTMCGSVGVHAEVVHIEMNSIEKGIVELIEAHGIKKLVMGAAADKHYSKKMMKPKSKKAIYVHLQAPLSCHIWFICKGNLVHTREGRSERVSMDVASLALQATQNNETTQSNFSRSQSIAEGANDQLRLTNSGRNYHIALSTLPGMRIPTFSSNRSRVVPPRSSSIAERSSVDCDEPCNSHYSSRSSDDMADVSALTLVLNKKDRHQFSSAPSVLEGCMSAELYDQLEQSMAEVENSKREAFDESRRRRKAEKVAIDAIHRAKASERLYAEEVRQRKEVEEALARVKEELRKTKHQVAEVAEELYIAVEHESSLESQIANSNLMVKDLEQKLFSAEKLLQKYKKERDELQAERDNALKEAEELRKEKAEPVEQAQQLAHIAMRCCEMNGRSQPDLASDVWRVLERMRVLCGAPPFLMNSEEDCHIPLYFMCPIFQAKASENLHGEELRQTKEVKEMVNDLEQKMLSAVQLSQKYNHLERDELQIECNNVLKEAKELRKEQSEVVVYTPAPVFFSEFSYSEIVQATSSFNQSLMIGQGGCGDIYKGILRHIQLAIKMLHSNSMQGPLEFQQEAVMEELIKMAKISYESCSLAEKNTAQQFFKELNRDNDGKVSFHEFLGFIRDKGLAKMGSRHFFKTLDKDWSEILDFVQVMALYCMIQSGRPFCYGCDEFIPGMYFTCSSCHQSGKNVCCLCPECFENGTYCHEHDQFFDNYDMLEVKRMKGLDTHWKQQHQNWAKKKGNSLRDEIPFEVSSISMDEKLDSRRQFMHMSQFDRSSPRPLALPDGGRIVGSIASSIREVATRNHRAHLVGQDQCGSTVSHYEIRNNRETSDKQGLTMSLSCVEDHLQPFGCKHKDDVKSLCERQAFDATNNRANIIKADECGRTASNSDQGSARKALKRARLSNVLSVEDLQQHFGARFKDAAKGLGDSIAWKSVKVGDSPLGAQSNSIIFLVRQRTLTHKHFVRLKKSQDLQRSLRMDCSGGLSSQSAIGLPDGRHILSLSEKKIVRKTLKRKCRTMCVHILEDHRQHVDRRWENAAKASTTNHNSWQLVMHGVSTAKRICRQHGTNQWPFQKHFATRKRCSLGDERSVEATSLPTDEKLVSRLQLIHISRLGRFSPRRSTLPATALLSSEFAATINGANFVEQDQSGSTASQSGKKIIRQTANGEWINSSLSLENLQQLFGSKRKDAAESLSVSESTFKSICRQHGIERWPSQRGRREQQAFDATNKRANIIKVDELGPTASNSDKGSTRKALKRARLSNILSVEDLQQHFGARCKDAAKGIGDSVAWKSVKVLDSPLGAQSNSIIFSVRRRTLTHKHCVRLKKSQDLQRSLRMDCSGGLSSQSAIGLPDGRHILSLSEKKIVRKTLKRKCRTMCVHILEDHRHLDRRWENAAKASTTKHNNWQLVMHGVSTAKRICRQHGTNQWPFQRHFATRKRCSLGDERSVEATSLPTDEKLVSRLQLIHISWLGRFSPWHSTLPAIALLSSEFAATINGANFVEQDQSGSTASHSGKKIIRRTANGEWINSSISLENLQQLFGSKRKDAAESLGVSESTFKRICRQHGIERWPNQRGSQVLKPPDPAERNESPTCKALSTHGQIEIENEMVGQLHEPNEFPPYFFDGLPCWNTENGILFPQPQVASTQMSSGNMGSSGDCRNLLVSQAEPSLEGHGSEAIYWTMPPCSDLASSQQTPTIPYTMLTIPHTTPPLTIQQDMWSLTIKAIYGDTIIKFKLPLSSGIVGLKEEVSKRLKFELDSFEVKYKDECGDLILIACDEDLRDCLDLFNSSGNQEIRLLVFDRFANTTNVCKNCRSLKRKRA